MYQLLTTYLHSLVDEDTTMTRQEGESSSTERSPHNNQGQTKTAMRPEVLYVPSDLSGRCWTEESGGVGLNTRVCSRANSLTNMRKQWLPHHTSIFNGISRRCWTWCLEGHLKTATVFKGTSKTLQNELLDCMLSVL